MAFSSSSHHMLSGFKRGDITKHMESSIEFKHVKMPLLPRVVDLTDIDPENGSLYSPTVMQAIKEVFNEYPDCKISKTELRLKLKDYMFRDDILVYGVIINNHKIMVLYKGEHWSEKKFGKNGKQSYLAGKGASSKVKLIDTENHVWVADKILNASSRLMFEKTETLHEIEMLKEFHMLEFAREFPSSSQFLPKIHIIQQYFYHSDLFELVDINPVFFQDPLQFFQVLLNAALASKRLHDKNLVHRDLKLENGCLHFLSKAVEFVDQASVCANDGKRRPLSGTFGIWAPELLSQVARTGSCIYTKETDIFALGIIFKELGDHFLKYHPQFRRKLDTLIFPMLSAGKDCSYSECIDILSRKSYLSPSFNWRETISEFRLFAEMDSGKGRATLEASITKLKLLLTSCRHSYEQVEIDIADYIQHPDLILEELSCNNEITIIDRKGSHNFREHFRCQRDFIEKGFKIKNQEFPQLTSDNSQRITNSDRLEILKILQWELIDNPNNEFGTRLKKLKTMFETDNMRFYADLLPLLQACIEVIPLHSNFTMRFFSLTQKRPIMAFADKVEKHLATIALPRVEI